MSRARENFNDVTFKTDTGQFFPPGNYFNALRHIFWNLMDRHAPVLESPKCCYYIAARGKRCYLVEENRERRTVRPYEILNCTYEQLRRKIHKVYEE